jgi:putative addiction module component (TIGR02574 family)
MSAPILNFSHLTPEERIELAEQLWDSLDVASVRPSADEIAELRRRRAEIEVDGDLGQPWREVLDELEGGRG